MTSIAPPIIQRPESANGNKGRAFNGSAPYLSYSRINKYLTCPEQYRLYYVEGWRTRIPSASLIFGQNVHHALNHLFTEQKSDPVAVFESIWKLTKDKKLTYSRQETWEKLNERGKILLDKFVKEERPKLTEIHASEKKFDLAISNLDLPFVGIIDLVARLTGKRTVVDFKTAGQSYDDHEVELSDQLSAYQLAELEAEQAALCVLVKTKEPKIEWFVTPRNSGRLREFLAKAELVGEDIARKRFYKRPGKHCGWCDFLPICLGDKKATAVTLMKAG